MGDTTKIQWCDHTWSSWRGCAKPPANADGSGIAPECWNCYAESFSKRNQAVLGYWGRDAPRVVGVPEYWDLPLIWNEAAKRDGVRRRVFFASMADVFEDRDDLIPLRARAFDVIDRCDWLDFLVLTKRPQLIRRLWPGGRLKGRPNVWLGTSCGVTSSLWRIEALQDCAPLCELLFVSAEPLLERVDFQGRLQLISWLILGGESGSRAKARRLDIAWIRSAIADAKVSPGRPSVFVKQLGRNPIDGMWTLRGHNVPTEPNYMRLKSRNGGDPSEWPEDLRVREFPRATEGVINA